MAGCYFAAAAVARAMAAVARTGSGGGSGGNMSASAARSPGRALRAGLCISCRSCARPPGHQVLKFFVSTEAQHFLATAGRIPARRFSWHDIKELLELERCTAGEHRNQFFGHKIRNSTGKCVFLENSHRRQ